MITLICATHRPHNQTLVVVEKYREILREFGEEVKLFRMDELPDDFTVRETFGERSSVVRDIIDQKLVKADKLVVISPEYNGSFPGIFKAFLDGVHPKIWKGKKAALVGVASGRAGNLRGMDHLTDVFHYLRIEVFSLKVPISRLNTLVENSELIDDETIEVLRQQAREFLKF